jgi:PPOX class probable F420-dependent enzyme
MAAMTLDDTAKQLVDGRNFGVLATVNPDGSPQTSVLWVGLDGDTVVISAMAHRKKVHNIQRDPRVSLTVIDAANPYRFVEIRGRADVTDDPERSLDFQLSHKYDGEDPSADPPGKTRVIVRITPEKVITYGD